MRVLSNLSAPDILAIVAANGLGHFRRTIRLLANVRKRVPGTTFHVLCEEIAPAAAGCKRLMLIQPSPCTY